MREETRQQKIGNEQGIRSSPYFVARVGRRIKLVRLGFNGRVEGKFC